jgi:phosphatidylinositol alpha-1,6-mannosyltransferase
MRNVLVLCKGYPPTPGGVETYSEQVVRAYLRRGLAVTVITQTETPAGWQTRQYPEGGVRLYNTGGGGQGATALRMLRALRVETRTADFDLCHATTWRPALVLSGVRSHMPTVVSVHGREILVVPRALRSLMRMVLRRADVVAVVSTATLDRAREAFGRSVDTSGWVVARNGLSSIEHDEGGKSNAADGTSNGRVRFFTLARLVERKNVQGCITAFQSLKQAGYSNFEYWVGGTGPLFSRLQQQVEDAGLADSVRLLGYVEDSEVPRLYEWADVFLHPQIDVEDGKDFEGFGLSIADSMASGCLAVAGAGAGPSDFIEDGRTGILVDGRNQQALEDVIRRLLDERELMSPIAEAGQRYVREELSWDKHIEVVLSTLR